MTKVLSETPILLGACGLYLAPVKFFTVENPFPRTVLIRRWDKIVTGQCWNE